MSQRTAESTLCISVRFGLRVALRNVCLIVSVKTSVFEITIFICRRRRTGGRSVYFRMQLKWGACIWVLWDVIFTGVRTARKIKELKGKIYTSENEFHLFIWEALELKRNTGKQNRKRRSPIHSCLFRKPTIWEKSILHRSQHLSLSRLAMTRWATVPLALVHKSAQTPLAVVLVGKTGPHSTFCTLECHYVITNTYLYWGSFPKVSLSRSLTSLCLA